MSYTFNPIGTISSDFKEKFGIPRQPGLCESGRASILLPTNRFNEEAIRDLESYSHIWIIFVFHDLKKIPDKARVRPPRLGGNKYVGVFSSRSPYRPNPIGLSVVKLEQIIQDESYIYLEISNHDLLHGTPVLDIKPYISFDKPKDDVLYGWQEEKWENLEVSFDLSLTEWLKNNSQLKDKITEILQNDPRPAYQRETNSKTIHGITIENFNINFFISNKHCTVTEIKELI